MTGIRIKNVNLATCGIGKIWDSLILQNVEITKPHAYHFLRFHLLTSVIFFGFAFLYYTFSFPPPKPSDSHRSHSSSHVLCFWVAEMSKVAFLLLLLFEKKKNLTRCHFTALGSNPTLECICVCGWVMDCSLIEHIPYFTPLALTLPCEKKWLLKMEGWWGECIYSACSSS